MMKAMNVSDSMDIYMASLRARLTGIDGVNGVHIENDICRIHFLYACDRPAEQDDDIFIQFRVYPDLRHACLDRSGTLRLKADRTDGRMHLPERYAMSDMMTCIDGFNGGCTAASSCLTDMLYGCVTETLRLLDKYTYGYPYDRERLY